MSVNTATHNARSKDLFLDGIDKIMFCEVTGGYPNSNLVNHSLKMAKDYATQKNNGEKSGEFAADIVVEQLCWP